MSLCFGTATSFPARSVPSLCGHGLFAMPDGCLGS
jgi:hypothetical protein